MLKKKFVSVFRFIQRVHILRYHCLKEQLSTMFVLDLTLRIAKLEVMIFKRYVSMCVCVIAYAATLSACFY